MIPGIVITLRSGQAGFRVRSQRERYWRPAIQAAAIGWSSPSAGSGPRRRCRGPTRAAVNRASAAVLTRASVTSAFRQWAMPLATPVSCRRQTGRSWRAAGRSVMAADPVPAAVVFMLQDCCGQIPSSIRISPDSHPGLYPGRHQGQPLPRSGFPTQRASYGNRSLPTRARHIGSRHVEGGARYVRLEPASCRPRATAWPGR